MSPTGQPVVPTDASVFSPRTGTLTGVPGCEPGSWLNKIHCYTRRSRGMFVYDAEVIGGLAAKARDVALAAQSRRAALDHAGDGKMA